MRTRINRNAIASSYNYTSSRKAHIAMLKENHEKNSSLFMAINSKPKEKDDMELFLDKIRRTYEECKRKRAAEEAEFKAKFKALLKH